MDNHGQTVSATRFAAMTGVGRDRLRTWERRFGFPEPVRIGDGPRRYAVEDVSRVVAVRRAAEDGTPLALAIAQAAAGLPAPALDARTFRAMVERAPVPIGLISGPAPLALEWGNAALRGLDGTPAVGSPLERAIAGAAADALREHFTSDLPALELDVAPWSETAASGTLRAVAYRLPVAPGEHPLVAVVGLQTASERDEREARLRTEEELGRLRRRADRQERWLSALTAVADAFQHEPGVEVVGAALDALVRHTGAVDAGVARYLSGRLALAGSRRGTLGAREMTVAAHPEVARALRDAAGARLGPAAARALGVPQGLHAAGLPIAVGGETLGLLVLVFGDAAFGGMEPGRLLAPVSAALGFALLRERLVRELEGAVSWAGPSSPAPLPSRPARPDAGARRPDG